MAKRSLTGLMLAIWMFMAQLLVVPLTASAADGNVQLRFYSTSSGVYLRRVVVNGLNQNNTGATWDSRYWYDWFVNHSEMKTTGWWWSQNQGSIEVVLSNGKRFSCGLYYPSQYWENWRSIGINKDGYLTGTLSGQNFCSQA
jgi:hypothetical protein